MAFEKKVKDGEGPLFPNHENASRAKTSKSRAQACKPMETATRPPLFGFCLFADSQMSPPEATFTPSLDESEINSIISLSTSIDFPNRPTPHWQGAGRYPGLIKHIARSTASFNGPLTKQKVHHDSRPHGGSDGTCGHDVTRSS